MKWICEIVRDFDGTYYANMTDEEGKVSGLPEYVDYKTLLAGIREKTGRCLPQCKSLKFKKFGRKQYAYINAACYLEGEGCCITYDPEKMNKMRAALGLI